MQQNKRVAETDLILRQSLTGGSPVSKVADRLCLCDEQKPGDAWYKDSEIYLFTPRCPERSSVVMVMLDTSCSR